MVKEQLLTVGQLAKEMDITVRTLQYYDKEGLLKQNNENYWVVKAFNEKLSDHVRDRFKDSPDSGKKLYEKYLEILDKAVELKKNNISPTGEEGIALGKEWWDMIYEFTGGDLSILPELMKFNENKNSWDSSMAEKQQYIDDYLEQVLPAYFQSQNIIIHEIEV